MRRLLIAVTAAVLIASLTAVPTGAEVPATTGITAIRATASQLVVQGRAAGVVAVHDITTGIVLATTTPSGDRFEATVPRLDGAHDRYFDALQAADKHGTAVGPVHHVDDVAFAAASDYGYPAVPDKKGLQVEMTDDAEQLGVAHAAINVAFDQLMLLSAADPANTIPFASQGQTYYVDRSYVAALDAQIKPLSDNGTLVNLILILYRNTNPNSAFSKLVHPDAALGSGTVYAFDTKTQTGTAYFTAAMRFLAQRYLRADQRYGRAFGWIVGNEVDSSWVWQNMGEQTLPDFVDYYSRALRIAWLATREQNATARVYVSLDHQWTQAFDPAQPTRYYPGKDFVDQLAALTRAQGDFGWDIAYHPYPQDLTDAAFWKDTRATGDADTTPLITFKNIEVLPAYLQRPQLEFDGAPRRIILSEQGCNARSGSVADQQLQAACYAYAYYKVRFLPGIDAFILHRHVDHQSEGGLHLGLWSWDSARSESALPGTPKLAYSVFRDIDTAQSLAATRFALPVIGASGWQQLIPGFDPKALDQRQPPTVVPIRSGRVAGAPAGGAWQPADNASSIELVSGASRVHFDTGLPAWSTDATTWKGAVTSFTSAVAARSAVGVGVLVPSTPVLAPVQVRIACYAANGSVATATARVTVGSWGWYRLDVSHWAGRGHLTRVKAWVRAGSDADWRGSFDVAGVTLI